MVYYKFAPVDLVYYMVRTRMADSTRHRESYASSIGHAKKTALRDGYEDANATQVVYREDLTARTKSSTTTEPWNAS